METVWVPKVPSHASPPPAPAGSKAEGRRRNVQEKKSNLEDLLKKAANESRAATNAIMKRRYFETKMNSQETLRY